MSLGADKMTVLFKLAIFYLCSHNKAMVHIISSVVSPTHLPAQMGLYLIPISAALSSSSFELR